MKIRKIIAALAATTFIGTAPALAEVDFTAVKYEADTIGELQVAGEGFGAELARDYRYLSLFERDAMVDWDDAEYFADKAVSASNGEVKVPADPADWDIESETAMRELQQARTMLMSVLPAARVEHPNVAAQAQAYYDCWVEQQEEGWQRAHIAGCKEKFYLAMSQLEGLMAESEVVAYSVQGTYGDAADTGVVFFEFDQADLTPKNKQTLEHLAALLPPGGGTEIVITGHADRSGPTPYNEELSEARARAVQDYLAELGITETSVSDIRVQAYGETRPAIPTGDGVRLAENRRVQITVDANQ